MDNTTENISEIMHERFVNELMDTIKPDPIDDLALIILQGALGLEKSQLDSLIFKLGLSQLMNMVAEVSAKKENDSA